MTALGGAHRAPGAFKGAACSGDRSIDVGLVAFGNRGDDLFGGGIEGFEGSPRGGWHALAVDQKLVLLAKHLDGKIVTNDYNLNKVARLHGVGVINLNDLANALKPVCLPGEHLKVTLVKEGEEAGQGVGYLDDGTMVVVESGRDYVGKNVEIAVTSVLQTSAGRMIFGKFDHVLTEPARGKATQAAQ